MFLHVSYHILSFTFILNYILNYIILNHVTSYYCIVLHPNTHWYKPNNIEHQVIMHNTTICIIMYPDDIATLMYVDLFWYLWYLMIVILYECHDHVSACEPVAVAVAGDRECCILKCVLKGGAGRDRKT